MEEPTPTREEIIERWVKLLLESRGGPPNAQPIMTSGMEEYLKDSLQAEKPQEIETWLREKLQTVDWPWPATRKEWQVKFRMERKRSRKIK